MTWQHLSSAKGDLSVPPPTVGMSGFRVVDLDEDGATDYVHTLWESPEPLVWYRRTPGTLKFTKYLIDATADNLTHGEGFRDIDRDGDIDLLFGDGYLGNNIYWWENPYPKYNPDTPWIRHLIRDEGANKYHDSVWGDFDGDGADEYMAWNTLGYRLLLLEMPADPTEIWPATTVFAFGTAHDDHFNGAGAADVNLDGKIDLICGAGWFEHLGGTNYVLQEINPDKRYRYARTAVGQLIPGGRPEIVTVLERYDDAPLYLYEWTNTAWKIRTVLPAVARSHTLQVGDVDQDGHRDIMTGELGDYGDYDGVPKNPRAKVSVLYGDGLGNFSQQVVHVGQGTLEGKLADIDDDGDLDIVASPYRHNMPRIDIWLNRNTVPLSLWQRHVLDDAMPWPSLTVDAADVNQDGFPDVVSGGGWYRNPGGVVGTWDRTTIGGALHNVVAVHDFDSDGDPDVLGTDGAGEPSADRWVWARNEGAAFTIIPGVSTGGGDFPEGAVVNRFQPDESLAVVVSWHTNGLGTESLRIPSDPGATPWARSKISLISQQAGLSSGDIDGDGDPDLLLGTQWLQNNGTSWKAFRLDPADVIPCRTALADINGDGRLDAIVGLRNPDAAGSLMWYEQPAKPTNTWTEHPVSTSVIGPMSLGCADMDRDGDIDVVVGEHRPSAPESARLILFENVDGTGTLWEDHVVHTGDEHHRGVRIVDIHADGDRDILSIGSTHTRLLLYENRAIVDGVAVARASTPVITPASRVHTGRVQVVVTSGTTGADIHYTLDGSVPSTNSTLYTGPLALGRSATVSALAVRSNVLPSTMARARYEVLPDTAAPAVHRATAVGKPDRVVIRFTEPVDAATATQPAHYHIDNGITVVAAAQSGESTVVLETSPLTTGIDYTIALSNVLDLATPPNPSDCAHKTPFTYQPLPGDGPDLWFRSDLGVRADEDGVWQWDDQSGNGRHAGQSDDFSQPQLRSDAVNGLPVVGFDGLDDYLAFTMPVNGLEGMSVFVISANAIAQNGGNSQAGSAVVFWNETTAWGTVYLSPYQASVHARFGTTQKGNRMIYTRPGSVGSTLTLTSAIKSGPTGVDAVFVDGIPVMREGGKSAAIAGCRDTGNLGRGYNDDTFFAGDLAEVIVYERALSDEERLLVEHYLRDKYDAGFTPTVAQPPNTHAVPPQLKNRSVK